MAKFLDWPGLQRFWNRLKTGSLIPGLAENLASWAEDLSPVSNSWDQTFRSTAGDNPIETTSGGTIQGIKAKTDFKCAGLRATAYNQLRLASNGGGAVAVGSGWYFPVPKLEYGSGQDKGRCEVDLLDCLLLISNSDVIMPDGVLDENGYLNFESIVPTWYVGEQNSGE